MALLSFFLMFMLVSVQGAAAAFNFDEDERWVKIHGWVMWASMGLLLPLGVLVIRCTKLMADVYETPSSVRVSTSLFYLHIVCQILGIALATGGVALLFAKVETQLNYTHKRLGLAIICLMLCQPLIGLLRPPKGSAFRSVWFFFHWLFGTGALYLGIIDIYIGIQAYEHLSTSSVRTLNIIFSVQIATMCLFYLLQDRYGHMISQGERSQQKAVPQQSTNL